jgi:hypothetical protein
MEVEELAVDAILLLSKRFGSQDYRVSLRHVDLPFEPTVRQARTPIIPSIWSIVHLWASYRFCIDLLFVIF